MVLALLRNNVVAFGLFDTLVPIASILTVSGLTALILPKHEAFGLFLLVWWLMVVGISIQDQIFANPTRWSPGDWRGVVLLLGVPLGILGTLYTWFQRRPAVRVLLLRDCPLWCLIAIHVYRLDGLSILWPLWNGNIPKYLGLQTILLDVLIGASSIPLLWMTYRRGVAGLLVEGGWRRHGVWLWNSLGLYDLVSAYALVAMNFAQVGGGTTTGSATFITDPPLAVVGFHPIPLIVLFQAPLAIGTHLIMLTSMDVIIQKQGCTLPLHARIERVRGRKSSS